MTLASERGGIIDGAWWPHTGLIAAELADLVGALHKWLGEVIDIQINWSPSDGQLDLPTIATGVRLRRDGDQFRRPRLMKISGRIASVKLLVVPSLTSPALGSIVVRAAAGMPAWSGDGDAKLFDTAQVVIGAARDECVRWSE